MMIRAKTYIADLVSIDAIVTVYYYHMTGGSSSGDKHNFWEFQYVDKGVFNVVLDGVRHNLTEGQIIMYAPDSHHSSADDVYDANVGIVSFESSSPALFENHSRVITITRNMRELLAQIITDGVDIFVPVPKGSGLKGLVPKEGVTTSQLQILKHKLELFLTELCIGNENGRAKTAGTNQSNYHKSQLEKIEDFLKSNLDKNLSLEDLCCEFSISESKLKNIFKEEKNTSPIAYFNSLKIMKAKQLINESTMNFSQIAECLGFSYVNYFSKVFKKKTGMTPSEYSKSICKK
jgi:AraC-like DNA-binding protein